MPDPIRLLVADDHTVMRQGLAGLLDEEPDLDVVAQAGTGRAAVTLARWHRPDLALLDISMPEMSGLDAARQIADELAETKSLILTMHDEEAFFFEALRAGAAGYVLKGVPSEELLTAIRAIHEGGVYLPPALTGHLVQEYLDQQPEPSEDDPLTPRERQVVTLIAQGLTNSDIADRLTLSVNTVKTHRRHIYRKLDIHSRAALIAYALRRGLLHP